MNFTQEQFIGLIAIALVALVVVIWVLRANRPAVGNDRPTLARDDATMRPTLPRAPLADIPGVTPVTPVPEDIATMTPAQETPPIPQAATPAGPADDLTRMKGVGPKVVATLAGFGVTRYDQIAAWSDADVERIDAQLGTFKGRVTRDQWVEQARLLAAGDTAGYQDKFGKL